MPLQVSSPATHVPDGQLLVLPLALKIREAKVAAEGVVSTSQYHLGSWNTEVIGATKISITEDLCQTGELQAVQGVKMLLSRAVS